MKVIKIDGTYYDCIKIEFYNDRALLEQEYGYVWIARNDISHIKESEVDG